MLTFGKTAFGASSSLCLIGNFCVSLCRNSFLCLDYFLTNRAVLTFGKATFGAGCCLCLIGNFCVSLCGNSFLCLDNCLANRAVLTFGNTAFNTSSSLCLICHLGVTLCRNGFRIGRFAALCADSVLRTRISTGCFLVYDPFTRTVLCLGNRLSFLNTAKTTSFRQPLFAAGRSLYGFPFAEGMGMRSRCRFLALCGFGRGSYFRCYCSIRCCSSVKCYGSAGYHCSFGCFSIDWYCCSFRRYGSFRCCRNIKRCGNLRFRSGFLITGRRTS